MITLPRRRPALTRSVDVVVIGAGHAGLSMSHCLSRRSIDHVVLERAEIASSWRRERWDSLRLLTPNWQSRLPGYGYQGSDPDGFMTMPEVIAFVEGYARHIAAPVQTGTNVTSVTRDQDRYNVETDRGRFRCRALVIASGAHALPDVPQLARSLSESIETLTAHDYRNPGQLDDRGVLVVGGSATGLQLADELQRSGRSVTLAVGEHIRMPRLYRGLDIQWWLDAAGILDQRYDEVDDIVRARRVPSPQLVGTPSRATLDLNALRARGVRIVGRLVGVDGTKAHFSGSLRNHCAMADLKLRRLLQMLDDWAAASRAARDLGAPERLPPTVLDETPSLGFDLRESRIGTVLWATGSRPDYTWLHVPALDRKGLLRHDGGVVDLPGLYVMGLNFMRRRKSSFIHGAEDDARDLSAHLAGYLGSGAAAQAPPVSRRHAAGG